MRFFVKIILLFLLFFYVALEGRAQCIVFNNIPNYNCFTSVFELTVNVTSAQSAPPYTVTSSPPGINGVMTGSTISFTNIPATPNSPYTNYNFTITSGPGCFVVSYISFSNPTASNNIVVSQTALACHGDNNASASVSYTLGSPPFTWYWSNGATTQQVSGLSPGTYSVAVTNSAGCTATTNVIVVDPPPISTTLSTTLITCHGGTINSAITTTGGASPYTYTVNGVPQPTAPTMVAAGLQAGVQIIITKDNHNCVETNTILLNEVAPQVITSTVNAPLCHNQANGGIQISVSGPVAGYSYSWSPVVGTSANFNNVAAGIYTVYVTDANNCITHSAITVPQTPAAIPVPLIKKENCSAADGAFTLSALGGTSPYTYTTFPGNIVGNVGSGLSSGIYTVIISDAHNCIDTGSFFLGNLSNVIVHALIVTPVKCYNVCDGKVILNVSNAASPITYSLSGMPTTTNNVIGNICAGFYLVKVTDANGCPGFDTINFPTPPVFTYSASGPSPICIGKSAQLKGYATGGTGTLTYLWNPGPITGATVNVEPVVTTTYSLNVYDSQGCTQAPYEVTVSVNPKISINVNASNSGICPGSTAQITPTVTGGDGNYSYLWLPGNSHGASIFVENITIPTYTLTVEDGCGTPKETKEITIKLHPVIQPTYRQIGQGGCAPYCVTFINTTPQSKNAIWNYGDRPFEQMGDTTLYCYNKAGNYNLRLMVTDSNSCKATYTYTNAVQVLVRPEAGFATDPEVITLNESEDVLIRNMSDNATVYQWFVGGVPAGSSRNIHYSFRDTGCYDIKLIVENDQLCRDSSTRSICVFEGFNFYMPSAFTPNNDGLNDVLLPKGTGWLYDNYKFEVYNRWGHKIFSTADVHQGWDGGVLTDESKTEVLRADPNNVFSWRAVVTDNMQKEHEMRGFVTLVR